MQNGSWPWDGMVLAFGLLFRGLMVSFIGAALVLRDISRKPVRGKVAREGGERSLEYIVINTQRLKRERKYRNTVHTVYNV